MPKHDAEVKDSKYQLQPCGNIMLNAGIKDEARGVRIIQFGYDPTSGGKFYCVTLCDICDTLGDIADFRPQS